MIVDLFAGGGGASQGIFLATGRHPDIAINHDPDAVAVHARNHPSTIHFCESVWKVRPEDACGARPVGLLWASPDCRHFSRAAGGRPKWKSVRSLPGVVLTWATRVRPRVIVVENVREMLGWGPLLDDGTPCPARVGLSFRIWAGRLRGLGYRVEWRELCAADFGTPTIRTRLVVVAARDGAPIVWPRPTHARLPSLLEERWRPAAECIDWSVPAPSIFSRRRQLKEATLRRIAAGVQRYVLKANEPFIVPLTHAGERAGHSLTAPLPTITAAHRGELALVSPHVSAFYGTSTGSPAGVPLGATTAQGEHHAVVAAFLAQHNGGMVGHSMAEPVSTIASKAANQALVTTTLSEGDREGAARVAAFLIQYYGSGGQHQAAAAPLGTVTTLARFALVTVHGVPRPIVDIGMRMLTPRELAAAQGFEPDYDLTDSGRLTKAATIRLIGNSVCPQVAAAVIRAQFAEAPAASEQVAA